jgi:serine/threonine protein kinase
VYRRGDPKKTEYIAKHLRKGSNELTILEYLNTKKPRSPHVIQFIDAVPSTTREWLVLPKLRSLGKQGIMDRVGVSGRVQLGWDLIKGLAYLHEHKIAHRDIKPDNLVCNDDCRLKIIDFDVVIQVQDENTEIDEYRGTQGWTAPEMGTEDGPAQMYSPIKADRWACGRVLLHHIIVGGMAVIADKRLLKLAHQLMANDPQQRPSLLEWHNFASPFSDAANAVEDNGKELSRPRQATTDVNGESIKLPNAKKARLEQPNGSTALRSMGGVF